jgi:hypothetical protein
MKAGRVPQAILARKVGNHWMQQPSPMKMHPQNPHFTTGDFT